MVDTNKLSREEMIDYIEDNSLYHRKALNTYSDDQLKTTYRKVFNIQLNK